MAIFRRESDKAAACGVEGLIERLGPLDKRDVQARFALIDRGAEAVPALIGVALFEQQADEDEVPPRVAAARTVLVRIGQPTLKAVEHVIATSDDRLVVADAAQLLNQTALHVGVGVPDDVKAEAERKTGLTWAVLTGEEARGGA